ncbi:acetolactate synthase catalytic subunit [Roseibium sp. M-1]
MTNTDLKPATGLVADMVAAALKRHKVEVMFSQSLPSRVVLACEDLGIRQITYRTENAGGTMADGFARLSGKVGVVCAQNGPAATLLVPPLAEAQKASIPVLAIVQEVNRPEVDRNAFQELDHLSLFASCTKWARKVPVADRIDDYIDMAMIAAATGRPGPVALMFPADLLNEPAVAPAKPRTQSYGHYPLDRAVVNAETLRDAAGMIADADLPVVIAGGGVHSSGATHELSVLQEAYGVAVGTTMMGKGSVNELHPLSLGLVGNAMGERSIGQFTKPIISDADVAVLVGNRTNQNGTDSWRLFPPTARIIHIDVDGQEIGRTYEALRLAGDAKLTLQALYDELALCNLSKRAAKRAGLEKRISDARTRHRAASHEVRSSDQSPIRPERTMSALSEHVFENTVLVADASYSSVWINTQLNASAPGMRFLTPRGLAGLGWGLPLAMGAQLARPDSTVVCVCGDGGFGHVWSELETLVRERLPVVVIVLNNSVLGYQKDAEDVKFGRHSGACQLGYVDHAQVAAACGCNAIKVEIAGELDAALERALKGGEPCLIDVVTDPEAYPPLSMFDGALGR